MSSDRDEALRAVLRKRHAAPLTPSLRTASRIQIAPAIDPAIPVANRFHVPSPAEFERYCESELRKAGWKTSLTPATGDQGADIIATCGAEKLVVQCKLYSQSVSNKAVQEIYTAMKYYGANKSAVISNAAFSVSAKELAKSTGVMLINASNILSEFNNGPVYLPLTASQSTSGPGWLAVALVTSPGWLAALIIGLACYLSP